MSLGNLTQERVWYMPNFVIMHFGFGIASHILMKYVFSIPFLFWNWKMFFCESNNLTLYYYPWLNKYNRKNDWTLWCIMQYTKRQSSPFLKLIKLTFIIDFMGLLKTFQSHQFWKIPFAKIILKNWNLLFDFRNNLKFV
jgi:hypothetical protein